MLLVSNAFSGYDSAECRPFQQYVLDCYVMGSGWHSRQCNRQYVPAMLGACETMHADITALLYMEVVPLYHQQRGTTYCACAPTLVRLQ